MRPASGRDGRSEPQPLFVPGHRARRAMTGASAGACLAMLVSAGMAEEAKNSSTDTVANPVIAGSNQAAAPVRSRRSPLQREEIETILPLFLTSEEARQLAGQLELRIRQGDLQGAKALLERAQETSTFAVLASEWVDEPMLLSMLHAQGIHGSDQPTTAASAEVSELKRALEQERERAQALSAEKAAALEKLASLQASRERTAAAAQFTELKKVLEQEREQRERAQALARVQVSREPAASAEVSELKKALEQERG